MVYSFHVWHDDRCWSKILCIIRSTTPYKVTDLEFLYWSFVFQFLQCFMKLLMDWFMFGMVIESGPKFYNGAIPNPVHDLLVKAVLKIFRGFGEPLGHPWDRCKTKEKKWGGGERETGGSAQTLSTYLCQESESLNQLQSFSSFCVYCVRHKHGGLQWFSENWLIKTLYINKYEAIDKEQHC